MDFLKDEIERKRKAIFELTSKLGTNKFIRTGDLEKLRQEKYHAENTNPARNAELATPTVAQETDKISAGTKIETSSENNEIMPSTEEILKRFRMRSLPTRLFGESDADRYARLKAFEFSNEVRVKGQSNQFSDLVKQGERVMTEALLMGEVSATQTEKLETPDIVDDFDATQINPDLLAVNPKLVSLLIIIYLKRVISEWSKSLAERPDEVKRSVDGKLKSATLAQTENFLKPLYKRLKKRTLQADVLRQVTLMLQLTIQREYMKANDEYIRLSIGNAPWPIGVTSVTMHERVNDNQIAENQIAHVLNDETQRKWIQSIKRLITFAQKRWPPDAMAKCVG